MTQEFRFYRYSQLPSATDLEPFLADVPGDAIHAYCAQEKWSRLPHVDWRLGVYIEWHTDFSKALPSKAIAALACALDVYSFARDELRLYQAILFRARSEVEDSRPLTWEQIAEKIGTPLSTLNSWKRSDQFEEKLGKAKAMMLSGSEDILGPSGLPYPGAEWMDPDGGSGWQVAAKEVCGDFIRSMQREYCRDSVARYAPAQLRKRMYSIARWHSEHKAVLPPIAVEALGYVMGLADEAKASGLPRHKTDMKESGTLSVLAKVDAKAIQQFGELPRARTISRFLGVTHVTVGRWRKQSDRYKALFEKELSRIDS